MKSAPDIFQVQVCVTGQHRSMLDQVLSAFSVVPDFDLNLMTPGQTLFQSTARIIAALESVLADAKPDLVVVQGDTTTTFCGALAAFYARVPVAHVEAGLRTWDFAQPFPEEMNRVLTSRLAELHFAATPWAAANLAREGVPADRVHVTGNSGIDAVLFVRDGLAGGSIQSPRDWSFLNPAKRLIVLTAHRRENFGDGMENICAAMLQIAGRGDVEIVYPVHPNPNVREPVERLLSNHPGIHLVEPLDYIPFVDLMRRAHLVITDSGGVQEEGPSLGKPILVLRQKTERPEAVEAGTVKLVGTDKEKIVQETNLLLDDEVLHHAMRVVHNPYGDGRASARIFELTRSFLTK